jgi:HSP20 family protein
MTQIKWQREIPVVRNHRVFPTMNDMFNEFFTETGKEVFKRNNPPAVNISENEKEFKIQFIVAGFKKEDFEINMQNNVLTVSASEKKENEEKNEKYSVKEFSIHAFSRSFNLPENLSQDAIVANYENGILTILLPKSEVEKPRARQITVQ